MRITLLIIITAVLSACSTAPQAIDFGNDACAYCKMTIVDPRFGAEIVTKKGKVYKYDAVECMVNAVFRDESIEQGKVGNMYVVAFEKPGTLVEASSSSFLHSEKIPSPMGMFLSAFSAKDAAGVMKKEHGGNLLAWKDAMSLVLEAP